MLINLSNHPSGSWSDAQRAAAMDQYGEVKDMDFPNIPPTWTHEQVETCAWNYWAEISFQLEGQAKNHPDNCPQPFGTLGGLGCVCPQNAVHLMGETSFVVAFARYWDEFTGGPLNLNMICSTTERIVTQLPDGTKQSAFRFVGFRVM